MHNGTLVLIQINLTEVNAVCHDIAWTEWAYILLFSILDWAVSFSCPFLYSIGQHNELSMPNQISNIRLLYYLFIFFMEANIGRQARSPISSARCNGMFTESQFRTVPPCNSIDNFTFSMSSIRGTTIEAG